MQIQLRHTADSKPYRKQEIASIIMVPVFILLFSLYFLLNYSPFYSYHNKYHYGDSMNVVRYVSSEGNILPAMSDAEKTHLDDVRDLIHLLWIIFIVSSSVIILIALSIRKLRPLLAVLDKGAIAAIILLMILVLLSINFDVFFTKFHHLFFKEGTWMFSYDSTLITLYPKAFWLSAFAFVLVNSAILSCITLALSRLSTRF